MSKKKLKLTTGLHQGIIRLRIMFQAYKQSRKIFGSHKLAYRNLKSLLDLRIKTHGRIALSRLVKVDKRYFPSLNIPGWPSIAFNSFLDRELGRMLNPENLTVPLQSVIFSITSRCTYHCEHCYEWDNISADESLHYEDLQKSLDKIHNFGISHVQFSGGEPLSRINDLIRLLGRRKKETDYWILSSGFELTKEVSAELKEAGLTGAIISLDHWDEVSHNRFRKHGKAYFWAKEAIRNCNEAGIVTALSLCATKEFISEQNLWKFANIAKDWGVGFIRILEPRSVGRYTGKSVLLSDDEKKVLEVFFLEINSKKKYKKYPIVMYPGFHQKLSGCYGAGNRYLYIDSKGEVHACPFCQGSVGNIILDELPEMITILRNRGCHMFSPNKD